MNRLTSILMVGFAITAVSCMKETTMENPVEKTTENNSIGTITKAEALNYLDRLLQDLYGVTKYRAPEYPCTSAMQSVQFYRGLGWGRTNLGICKLRRTSPGASRIPGSFEEIRTAQPTAGGVLLRLRELPVLFLRLFQ